jgi:hypothetical protein
MRAKHIPVIGDFEGFLEGTKTFFDPQIVLSDLPVAFLL